MNFLHKIRETIRTGLVGKCDEEVIEQLVRQFSPDNLPVVDEDNNVNFIDVEQVLYIEHVKTQDGFVCHTPTKEYQTADRTIDLGSITGDHFVQLDKTKLVNLKKVKRYNSFLSKVYFEEDFEKGTSLTITQSSMKTVIKKLGTSLDLYEESGLYAPKRSLT